MLSLPKRQSQPPETVHFPSHYPSHSPRSPLLSLEVSDTKTGNNQKSAELMPHKKHRTPSSLCIHPADLFKVVAVIPMCIFPLLKFSYWLQSLWHAWLHLLTFSFAWGSSFPLDMNRQNLTAFTSVLQDFWWCTEYLFYFVDSFLNLAILSGI